MPDNLSYCLIITGGPQRGRVGGPLGGPAAVSAFRVFHRISAFSGIFKISRDFAEFSEFSSFSWNGSFPRRPCENVDIPKGILMILRCPSLQSQYFLWKSWKSWKSRNFLKLWNFMKFHVLCGNVDFCSEAHPKIINIPIGISTFPVPGPGELRFHSKSRKFTIICNLCWNSRILRNPL